MMHKIQSNLIKTFALFLVIFSLLPISVYAADDVDIGGAACAGSNIKITSDPSGQACDDINQDGATPANRLVATIVNLLTVVVGIVAVIMIIYAGFRYVTSGGKDDSVKGAKNTILYAIIGLVVVAFAQVIVHFVINKAGQATNVPQCNNGKISSGPDKGHKCQ
jgi:heme/copper-type cytochrome/quinol oxidase subunit 2